MPKPWEGKVCKECHQPFATEEEWLNAHTAHKQGCPAWLGQWDRCECTEAYHDRCCPDCNGKREREAAAHFASIPTEKLIADLVVATQHILICDAAYKERVLLPPNEPDVPPLEVIEKDKIQTEQIITTLGILLEARGIDPTPIIRQIVGGG